MTALLRYNLHTYTIQPFKVCSPMFFSIFTDMCNHHPSQLEHFQHLKEKLYPLLVTFLSLHPAIQGSKQSLLYFLSIAFPILGASITGVVQYTVFCAVGFIPFCLMTFVVMLCIVL
jgi:hypothetical protein